VINAASLKSLDVYNNSAAAGANISQWDYWGGAGQKWSLTSNSGYYTVKSQLSNLPLDVLNLSTANGAQIIQWAATGATNQQFSLTRLK
jgi:arabinan endo-1,5-alpha-L-arabinosidase